MKKIWYCLLMIGLAFSLVLSGCKAPEKPAPPATPPAPKPAPAPAPPAPAPSEWDKVLAAAKKEGTVNIYNTLGADVTDTLRDEMMKAHGIKVEIVSGRSMAMVEKMRVEHGSEIHVADLFCTGLSLCVLAMEHGLGAPITVTLPAAEEKDVWRTQPHEVGGGEWVTISNAVSISIIINTDLVKKGEITSWNDLLDPKWKGKMVMTDPRKSGPGSGQMYTWGERLGEDFWKKMAEQDIQLQAKYGQVIDMVVHGERPVGLFPAGSRTAPALEAGAPISVAHFKEGTPTIPKGFMLMKNAPHPNAALVLINWTLTKEGQAATSKAWGTPTIRKDVVEDWVLPGFRFEDTFKIIEPPLGAKDADYGQIGIAFAKKIWPE
ncbi:ABC transporter substrate-binding protein [Chloroflexota bacterium]